MPPPVASKEVFDRPDRCPPDVTLLDLPIRMMDDRTFLADHYARPDPAGIPVIAMSTDL
jgi:hypothetical protein